MGQSFIGCNQLEASEGHLGVLPNSFSLIKTLLVAGSALEPLVEASSHPVECTFASINLCFCYSVLLLLIFRCFILLLFCLYVLLTYLFNALRIWTTHSQDLPSGNTLLGSLKTAEDLILPENTVLKGH